MSIPNATVSHIGIAVTDATAAGRFYETVLGAVPRPEEQADGARIISYPLGDVDVELLEPNDPTGPIAKFIDRRGPGIHHICLQVPDLDAALEHCREEGFRLIDEVPRSGAHGRRIAFVHPKTTEGVLLELTE
jgi:methylmalonyl-CoA epimerase